MTPRYVMDTSVLIAAMRSGTGAGRVFLQSALNENVHLFATTALVLEYESVLVRDAQTTLLGRSLETNLAFLDDLLLHVHPVLISWNYRPLLNDPKDEHVLEAAINARADLVTHNVRHFQAVAPRHGVRVLTPGSIINAGGIR